MSKIEQRLNTLFQEHRIIIWYDDGGSLKDEFDSINLDIKKLEINNNEFGIKVKVLYEDKESRYLIYSQNTEPLAEDNWLLDIEQSFYKFISILEYKSKFNGIEFVKADRCYPSSKTCSSCGEIKKDLKLKDRVFNCPSCNIKIDRDKNASINLSRYKKSA